MGTAPLASAAGTPLGALADAAREELLRLTYQSRFAQPYAAKHEKHAAPATDVLEDIKDLFRPLDMKMKEEGFLLEDEADEDEDEDEEEEEEEEEGEEETCVAGEDGQCAAPSKSRRCPIGALFNAPMVR